MYRILGSLAKIFFTVLFLLAGVEFSSFLLVQGYHLFNPSESKINLSVYQNQPWAKQYFKEFQKSFVAEYAPYVGHRRLPNFQGETINIDQDSLRRTVSCSSVKKPIKIFMFGGSTMWGTGVRDQTTIPSALTQILCAKNIAAEVKNFGESGYTSTQEMIRLQLELRRGERPDLVIFYDGVNDVFSSYQNGEAGLPQNVSNRRYEFNLKDRLNIRGAFSNFLTIAEGMRGRDGVHGYPVDPQTAKIYLENLRIVQALAKEYGFHPLFYWQPAIFTKKNLSQEEKEKITKDETLGRQYLEVTQWIASAPNIKNLSDIFDDSPQTIFTDWAHVSEDANRIIAQKMAGDMESAAKNLFR